MREAGPVKGGKTVIAFVKDPTGYMWELIERPSESPEPFAQVCARQHLGTSLDRLSQAKASCVDGTCNTPLDCSGCKPIHVCSDPASGKSSLSKAMIRDHQSTSRIPSHLLKRLDRRSI